MGYDLHSPEGTFYLMPRSPLEDDLAFTRLLMAHKIYCLPGAAFEMPGYFRISLTANDEMIERSLPGFEAALQSVRQQVACQRIHPLRPPERITPNSASTLRVELSLAFSQASLLYPARRPQHPKDYHINTFGTINHPTHNRQPPTNP